MLVYRIGDQSAISVAKAVNDYVARVAQTLPAGITIDTWQDSSALLESRINLLVRKRSFRAGAGLRRVGPVFSACAWRSGSRSAFRSRFLGAIACMGLFDVSISMISLFSFILVLGIVVDDAIVVGENIPYHASSHRQADQRRRARNASSAGTCHVRRADHHGGVRADAVRARRDGQVHGGFSRWSCCPPCSSR